MDAPYRRDPGADFRLLINGRLVVGAASFDVIDPATGQIIAGAPCADGKQLEAAVAAARTALPAWSETARAARGDVLLKLAAALAARTQEFARLLTLEQGKPLVHALAEVADGVALMRWFATMDLPARILKQSKVSRVIEHHVPLGVVAAITSCDFPLGVLIDKLAPALLAGNTMVANPATTTPLTSLRFGELCADIVPAGVVNVITGASDLGAPLTAHPDVAKVTFSGSMATGRKVLASVAGTCKHVMLEVGGNDAAIILDDADVMVAAPKLFHDAMRNSGQACRAIKRIYAHASLHERMCEELAKLAEAARLGNGLDPDTEFGPLQNRARFEHVTSLIGEAGRLGKIVAGGQRVQGPGYFVRPTIVRDLPGSARLVRDEQFGPVVPVLCYAELADAITRINASEHRLGSSVWSSDPYRAYLVATRIESATVWVNTHADGAPDLAAGGAGQSGLDAEFGRRGLEAFTRRKLVNVAL